MSVHEKIGHLGIFVSGKVAKKEHREIIGSVEMIEYLPPGLYEMVIEAQASKPWLNDYTVNFEARTMADILSLDDGTADEAAFQYESPWMTWLGSANSPTENGQEATARSDFEARQRSDEDRALNALARLMPPSTDRAEAVELGNSLTFAGLGLGAEGKALAAKIKKILDV